MTNFKKFTTLVATTAAVALIATPATAAPVSNSNGKAKARILKPLTLTETGEIDFGTIVLPSSGAGSTTLSVAPSAAATMSQTCAADGFTCDIANGASSTNMVYNITGTNNTPIEVVIPATATITNPASDTLTVNLSTSLSDPDSDGDYDMTLPNSGAPGVDFYVGGSLTVGGATPEGLYEGTFTITADYQ